MKSTSLGPAMLALMIGALPAYAKDNVVKIGVVAAETGDFTPGKSADLVRLFPAKDTPLGTAMAQAESLPGMLATLIAQAGAESVREVRVRGKVVAL